MDQLFQPESQAELMGPTASQTLWECRLEETRSTSTTPKSPHWCLLNLPQHREHQHNHSLASCTLQRLMLEFPALADARQAAAAVGRVPCSTQARLGLASIKPDCSHQSQMQCFPTKWDTAGMQGVNLPDRRPRYNSCIIQGLQPLAIFSNILLKRGFEGEGKEKGGQETQRELFSSFPVPRRVFICVWLREGFPSQFQFLCLLGYGVLPAGKAGRSRGKPSPSTSRDPREIKSGLSSQISTRFVSCHCH